MKNRMWNILKSEYEKKNGFYAKIDKKKNTRINTNALTSQQIAKKL